MEARRSATYACVKPFSYYLLCKSGSKRPNFLTFSWLVLRKHRRYTIKTALKDQKQHRRLEKSPWCINTRLESMVTCPRGEWKTTCRAPVKLLSRQIYTARACKQLALSSRWTTALTVNQITDLGALDAPHSDVKYKPKRHNSKHCVCVCVCKHSRDPLCQGGFVWV